VADYGRRPLCEDRVQVEARPGSAIVVRLGPRARRLVLGIAFGGGFVVLLANLPFADALLDADTGTFRGQAAVKLHEQLDVGSEVNLATWWSSAVLALAALAAFAVAAGDGLRRGRRLGWCAVGALLVLLSADEIAQTHESLAWMVDAARGPGAQLQIGAGDWIPILAPAVVLCAVAIAIMPFVLLSGRRAAQLCVLAALALWLVSIFLEAVEGGLVELVLQPAHRERLEEGSELLGTTLLLAAFLDPLMARPTLVVVTEMGDHQRSPETAVALRASDALAPRTIGVPGAESPSEMQPERRTA
jgi:hypothetical protein